MCKSIKLTIVTIFCLAIAVIAFFVAFESTEVAYADEDYFYVQQEPQNKIAVSSTIEFSNTDGTGLFPSRKGRKSETFVGIAPISASAFAP